MAQTLREARRRFFVDSGFAADGGYDDTWQDARFGPVPYAVPNPGVRKAALRVHDLHHPLTGYAADWRGEAQISAWELGSGGGGRYPYAWFIALFGFVTGLLGLPGATWRAFVRGRRSRNLYREADPMRRLDAPLSGIRAELAVSRGRLGTVALFTLWAMAGLLGSVFFVLGIPVLVAAGLLRRGMPCMRCPLSCASH